MFTRQTMVNGTLSCVTQIIVTSVTSDLGTMFPRVAQPTLLGSDTFFRC